MRKEYHKPELYAESFALVEHISYCDASGVKTGTINSASPTDCVLTTEFGFQYFTSNTTACMNSDDVIKEDDDTQISAQCYNGPLGMIVIVYGS